MTRWSRAFVELTGMNVFHQLGDPPGRFDAGPQNLLVEDHDATRWAPPGAPEAHHAHAFRIRSSVRPHPLTRGEVAALSQSRTMNWIQGGGYRVNVAFQH